MKLKIIYDFFGEFNKNGHTISEMHIYTQGIQYVGLFSFKAMGNIRNLTIRGTFYGTNQNSEVGCIVG